MKTTIAILFIAIVYVLVGYSLYKISKAAGSFYLECDKLEKDIQELNNETLQVKRIYDLNKKSFHRATSSRVRELAKMIEIKYKVKIT